MQVTFVGLGKLGFQCSEVFAESGFIVNGYDIRDLQSHPNKVTVFDELGDSIKGSDIIFVAVQTPHDPMYGGDRPTSDLPVKDFDYSHVKDVLARIDEHANKRQLVVLISTVLPGTCRNQLRRIIRKAKFAYNPYLIAMSTVKEDMVNPEMVIIGTDRGDNYSLDLLSMVYKQICGDDVRIESGSYDDAEAIKIFYNTFISAKLAITNTIMDVSQANGNMDVDVVTGALARSSMRITGPTYMKAGLGDGGPCHPRDNIALSHLSKELGLGYDLFGDISRTREAQAKNLARIIELEAFDSGIYLIVIIGKSYKEGIGMTDGSYTTLLSHYLDIHEEWGPEVFFHDPSTGDEVPESKRNRQAIFLAAAPEMSKTYPYPNGSVIVDPWRTMPDVPGCKVLRVGKPF